MNKTEIVKILLQKEVPLDVVFNKACGGKYLNWGGKEIIDAVVGEDVVDWYVEPFDMPEYDEWYRLLNCVENNKNIQLIHYNTADDEIVLLVDKEIRDTIELCGGFENYTKTLGE